MLDKFFFPPLCAQTQRIRLRGLHQAALSLSRPTSSDKYLHICAILGKIEKLNIFENYFWKN